ncbi:acetyl-CoA C-acyltransferase [uncultured Arthrobacter sp.]|uniref:acetyl-CoA C-acyltransferase n=1 Tax=uncultured Arthrobacter sp. TaxID=114050 RepID=UPI0028D3BFA1|nr:acetyl-CoA C-acyltransferase [uncultured Arthrobacter sp.]
MTAESLQQRTKTALIAGYARTPFVRFGGHFSKVPAVNLGAHAAAAALRRAGVSPEDVQRVVVGHVLQGGVGQNPARQTAVGARIPYGVPALTINAVCLSGMEAVVEASRLITSGEADIVLAVGQESMSLAPHVLGARAGQKYGAMELVDTLERDGLTDAFEGCSMGVLTDDSNTDLGIARSQQDDWAAASHQRAATHSEFQAGEIEPYTLASRGGDVVITQDDGIRPGTTPESLAALRPAFDREGTVTAGNASQITDGAAALVLVSPEAAQRFGLSPIAAVESHAIVAGPDVRLHSQPANAILAALKKTDISCADLTAIEINEAFAAIVVQSINDLDVDAKIVNSRGGAVALGHPIGASGARIVGALARQLAESGPGSFGAAGICGGGGQGSAVVLRAV